MANKRINDLQIRSDFDGTVNLAGDDTSQTWRVTGAQILAYVSAAATLISGKSAKTTLVAADTFLLGDSAASDALKKVTKLNLFKNTMAAKTAAYTATLDDDVVTGDPTVTAAFTITLPAAATCAGKELHFTRLGTAGAKLTIDGNGSETINGALTWVMYAANECVKIISDGANWIVTYRWPEKHVAILKDLKASGTNPGGSVSGTWTKRDLNDLQGGDGWLALASSVMALDPGTYEMWGNATCYGSDGHQPRFYNTSDSTIAVVGQSNYVNSAASSIENSSNLLGTFTITAAKNFELQHRVSTTKTVTGWGQAAGYSISECYALVKLILNAG